VSAPLRGPETQEEWAAAAWELSAAWLLADTPCHLGPQQIVEYVARSRSRFAGRTTWIEVRLDGVYSGPVGQPAQWRLSRADCGQLLEDISRRRADVLHIAGTFYRTGAAVEGVLADRSDATPGQLHLFGASA